MRRVVQDYIAVPYEEKGCLRTKGSKLICGMMNAPTQQDETPRWAQAWLQQMQQTVDGQAAQIRELRQQINGNNIPASAASRLPASMSGSISTPGSSTPSLHTSANLPGRGAEMAERKKDRLPAPPEFAGKRSEFRSWLTQMHAKLAIDKAEESEDIRFWYIYSRLREDALVQVDSWVAAMQATGSLSVEGLVEQLKAAYEDNESSERAARKLNVMRQGSKPFGSFLAEFDRTLMDAGGLGWMDQVKKTFLSNCLSAELQAAIVATPTPLLYREYCSMLQTVSTNLEAVKKRKQREGSRRTIAYPTATEIVAASDTMDWEPARTTLVASAQARRAQWVPQDVIDKRRLNKRCLRCGADDHFVRECTLLPATRRQAPRTDRKHAAIAVATTEEPISSDEERGNA